MVSQDLGGYSLAIVILNKKQPPNRQGLLLLRKDASGLLNASGIQAFALLSVTTSVLPGHLPKGTGVKL